MVRRCLYTREVQELSHALRTGELVLRWHFETPPYFKLHSYGLHIMHVILTKCIMGSLMHIQKLYNILLVIKAINHKKDTLLSPLSASLPLPVSPWQKIGTLSFFTQVQSNLWECIHFQQIYTLVSSCTFCPTLFLICQKPETPTAERCHPLTTNPNPFPIHTPTAPTPRQNHYHIILRNKKYSQRAQSLL
jgi:hypothetical protein